MKVLLTAGERGPEARIVSEDIVQPLAFLAQHVLNKRPYLVKLIDVGSRKGLLRAEINRRERAVVIKPNKDNVQLAVNGGDCSHIRLVYTTDGALPQMQPELIQPAQPLQPTPAAPPKPPAAQPQAVISRPTEGRPIATLRSTDNHPRSNGAPVLAAAVPSGTPAVVRRPAQITPLRQSGPAAPGFVRQPQPQSIPQPAPKAPPPAPPGPPRVVEVSVNDRNILMAGTGTLHGISHFLWTQVRSGEPVPCSVGGAQLLQARLSTHEGTPCYLLRPVPNCRLMLKYGGSPAHEEPVVRVFLHPSGNERVLRMEAAAPDSWDA